MQNRTFFSMMFCTLWAETTRINTKPDAPCPCHCNGVCSHTFLSVALAHGPSCGLFPSLATRLGSLLNVPMAPGTVLRSVSPHLAARTAHSLGRYVASPPACQALCWPCPHARPSARWAAVPLRDSVLTPCLLTQCPAH